MLCLCCSWQLLDVDCAGLLLALARAAVVSDRSGGLTNYRVVPFAHEGVLLIASLLLVSSLSIGAIDNVLAIWTEKLSVFEPLLLILLAHGVLTLTVWLLIDFLVA